MKTQLANTEGYAVSSPGFTVTSGSLVLFFSYLL